MLQLLRQRSFAALTATQFLGAFNDNAFKQLVLLLVVASGGGAAAWAAEHPLAAAWGQALPSALFALPFVLFGALTGSLADRVSKSRIVRGAKALEILVMALALAALAAQSYGALLCVVLLMGAQSALFGPSKYGALPELLPDRDLARANAVIQATTMIAIVLGVLAGAVLTERFADALLVPGTVFVGLALLGTAASLGVRHLPPADPARPLSWNVPAVLARHARAARGDRTLVLALLASALFYLIAATLLLVVNAYGASLGLGGTAIGTLHALTAIGIALGSVLAGRLSRGRIESGLVPIGLGGLALSLVLVRLDPASPGVLRVALLGAGASAGLFSIPIRALIQARPAPERKGAILGLSEVLDFTGILAASALYVLLEKGLGLAPDGMMVVLAGLVLVFLAGSLVYTADLAVRLVLLVLTKVVYQIRVRGAEHVPERGGAVLVANHLSFVDAFLVGASCGRPVRFLMHRTFFDLPLVGRFARLMRTLPVSGSDSPAEKRATLVRAAEHARRGELVCLFAEGAISRTGALLPFARGLERIARDADAPIVPVALDRVWGSVFSFSGARVFWKRPRRLPYPVDVSFGTPLPADTPAWRVREAVAELVARAREERLDRRDSLGRALVRAVRRHPRRPAIVDTTGARLSYRRLLAGALLLRRSLLPRLGPAPHVGVLLPPSAGGALANVALALAGRTSVNLNYSLSDTELADTVRRAHLDVVVTSRRFLQALDREPPAGARVLWLEDLLVAAGPLARLRALLATFLPAALLAPLVDRVSSARAPATIVFSSGSSARPKGVVLAHGNVLANVEAFCQTIDLGRADRLLGVLPFFHSFGYTVTLWAPLIAGATALYHASPLDARRIARLCREERATILLATPTFYQGWLRRLEQADVVAVRLAFAGAERLPRRLADLWRERFGFDLLEGYGCTELSPVVSVNVPDVAAGGHTETGHAPGTVGRPLPGVALRVVDRESGRPLAPGEEGLLLVRGANVMQGYLDQPDLTAEVLRDGWYSTGDVARLTRTGFLEITDRLSRFAKIGGEMVPHGKVEEALGAALARRTPPDAAEHAELAVTSVPDERKGERLVVLHTGLPCTAEELVEDLLSAGLPSLFVPRADAFVAVESIPKLPTGKTDLRTLATVALERVGC